MMGSPVLFYAFFRSVNGEVSKKQKSKTPLFVAGLDVEDRRPVYRVQVANGQDGAVHSYKSHHGKPDGVRPVRRPSTKDASLRTRTVAPWMYDESVALGLVEDEYHVKALKSQPTEMASIRALSEPDATTGIAYHYRRHLLRKLHFH